jgi:hypothetical protein
MYETDQARHDAIQHSARKFDLYDEEGEAEATQILDEMAGEADTTADEDQFGCNGFDALPLDKAIDIQRVSKSPVFQEIFGALKALHAECVEKSKNEKESADFRSLHHTKGLGVEASIGIFTAILEESEARLKAATPEERRAMGSEANQFISNLIEKPSVADVKKPTVSEPSAPARPPSAGVQRNTKAAQEFLAKSSARRNQ